MYISFSFQSIQRCRSLVKPCKFIVKVEQNLNTPEQIFTSPNVCSCAEGSCPRNWNDAPEKTITRYLRSKERVMILQLKFCRPVEPQRICTADESALTIKGRSTVPQEIVDFRCRCPSNRPMVVKKSWSQSYEHYQEYVCDLPRCRGSGSQCMSISSSANRRQESTHSCECRRGESCARRQSDISKSKGFCVSSLYY
ncbi:hypothetical protein SNE40_000748 [Patella caerulea]|uniref:Ig-like domain-containing protein n=1 Tax=Patella caerulea TaxID=87958 RepID=A0AAN8KKK1_PATCE